ncbi:unnamed protein product [Paramecium pentaurelia]|uniref:Mitogen-activated protein kinase n=1 Tax=Paramecium pentaurelia TaxID=43138 RepID=A0A8S1UI80_9CILI|nr:unnamed protein product [Paramecium pentaurelia]
MIIESNVPQKIIDLYKPYKKQFESAKHVLQGHTFYLDQRYMPIDIIGQGAYGCVIQAIDKLTNKPVAIKKIERTFNHRLFAKRTLRELKILRLIRHDNVVDLKQVLLPPSREEFEDVYMVMDLLEADLSQVIKSDSILNDDHMRLFIYQVLRGLKYLHSAGILHRDLKPRNLLLNRSCDVKICDFGLGRAIAENIQNNIMMTYYVETRWYRAPELLIGYQNYNSAVDIWSVGCILAEMILRRPFLRGDSTKHQIKVIFELLGTPNEQYIQSFPDLKVQQNLRKIIQEYGHQNGIGLNQIFGHINQDLLDLLKGLLKFDHRDRLTAAQALKHSFLQILHSEEDEPISLPVNPLEFEFEKYELTKEQLKDMLYEEILLYHFSEFRNQYFQKLQSGQSLISHIVNNENARIIDPNADDDFEQ